MNYKAKICNEYKSNKLKILYYTILYYIILYYITLYYIILYYIILYYIILCCTILYYTILYYIILYYIILYYIILYYIIFITVFIYFRVKTPISFTCIQGRTMCTQLEFILPWPFCVFGQVKFNMSQFQYQLMRIFVLFTSEKGDFFKSVFVNGVCFWVRCIDMLGKSENNNSWVIQIGLW